MFMYNIEMSKQGWISRQGLAFSFENKFKPCIPIWFLKQIQRKLFETKISSMNAMVLEV